MIATIHPLLAGPTFDFDSRQWFVIVLVVLGIIMTVIISLAGIISSTINSIHRRRIEEGLKQDMLDRGMSADDIAKVIEAATPPEDAAGRLAANWGEEEIVHGGRRR